MTGGGSDSGAYANFAKDAAGYGLAQWTFWTRKQNLLAYAKAAGKSVGDLETQLGFLMKELKESYGGVLTVLKSAGSVRQASDKVLLEFERPANQGTAVQEKRAGFGQKYYDTYAKAEEQEETSMGFKPRLTRPEAGNKYYITKSAGGYSDAIKGSPTDAACNVLHNCVGYAYGRFNEIVGAGRCKYLRPVNAENFMQYTNGLQVGQTPKLGACMVWRKGATLSGSDGAGHVAIVEQIISATEVVTSESGYGAAKPFWTQNRKKGTGNWGQGSGYVFLGFIYNPAVDDSESGTTQGTTGQTGSTNGKLTYQVGDTVNFTGTTHYTNSNAATGVKCKPGPAKVTAVAPSGKHPYHLVKAGGSCTVYGWVDAADIAGADGGTSGSDTLAVGDQVKMDKAATVYGTTGKFASWVYNSTLYVRSISGSRVVVSTQKTGAVTGAVDKKYLTKA